MSDKIVEFFKGKNTLRDSVLTSLYLVGEHGGAILELKFSLGEDADYKSIGLRFSDIIEFDFYYKKSYVFYNVEAFKLICTNEKSYYLSLDPDENFDSEVSTDQDFVKANSLEIIIDGVSLIDF